MAADPLVMSTLFSACALFTAGCGTAVHQLSSTMTYYADGLPAYGGVKFDKERIETLMNGPRTPARVGLATALALDMPLSAAADTALLPLWAIDNIGDWHHGIRSPKNAPATTTTNSQPTVAGNTE